jgi:hypothetical protein
MNGHSRLILRRTLLNCGLVVGVFVLIACRLIGGIETTLPPTYVEIPFSDLSLKKLDPDILTEMAIPGCELSDLPPFHWKEVNTGMVDIRTPEDYAIQTGSLYQEGYLAYQYECAENPSMCQSLPEVNYEEFLAKCNVFPEVDFSRYSLLGYHASGKGCIVSFEKHVYRDDLNHQVMYQLRVFEEGVCDQVFYDRNLILVMRIPSNYIVDFLLEHGNE